MLTQDSSKFIFQKSSTRLALGIFLSLTCHLLLLAIRFPVTDPQVGQGYQGVELVTRSSKDFLPILPQQKENLHQDPNKTQVDVASSPLTKAGFQSDSKKDTLVSTIQEKEKRDRSRLPVTSLKEIEEHLQKTSKTILSPDKVKKSSAIVLTNAGTETEPQANTPVNFGKQEKLLSLQSDGNLVNPSAGSNHLSLKELSESPPGSQAHLGLMNDTSQLSSPRQSAFPRYDINPKPEYPDVARLRGYQGTVELKVFVLADGRAGSVDIVTSSGYRVLDAAARKAVRFWKFQPATFLGTRVDSQVTFPIVFRLE